MRLFQAHPLDEPHFGARSGGHQAVVTIAAASTDRLDTDPPKAIARLVFER